MKMKRILSVFLLALLLLSDLAVPRAAALEPPEIQCQAALLMDQETGAVVYAKNEKQEMYPASLTKIMTALLVLEAVEDGRLSLSQEITASASALMGLPDDGSTAGIREGETLTVEDLLRCMLIVSANEACTILAEAASGSVDSFVEAMNAKAEVLGCANTHFVNPHGLHDPRHYTTAWDMYLITREAMTHPEFMTICNTSYCTIPATNLGPERTLRSTNYLINGWTTRGYLNSDAHGIKTGSTSQAGHCLVSSAIRGSMSLVSVVLGGERKTLDDGEIRTYSFYDTNQLFRWGFENFSYQTVLKAKDPVQEIEVALADPNENHVTVHPADDVDVLLPNDLTVEDLERTVALKGETVEAPVAEGDVLGTITLSHGDTVYATVDLLAMHGVEASRRQVFLRDAKLFLEQTWVRAAAGVILALVVLLGAWRLFFSRRRYRYGRDVSRSRRSGYRGRGRRR